jgi:hypothetical protein
MEWILFYYNSLPDLPSGCPFFSSHLMHRDYLMCNPSNTGHHKYPRFETLSYDEGCHFREVHSFLKRPDPEKYVIFYTRHTEINGHRSNKVIGYFRVGKLTKHPFGFIASDVVLLLKRIAISIPYTSRGVPTSWGKSAVKHTVNRILRELMALSKQDVSNQYQRETKRVMSILRQGRGRMRMLDTCNKCDYRPSCYWGSRSVSERKRTFKELYEKNKPC